MKRLGNIYQEIYSIENLKSAHKNASRSKGHYIEVKKTNGNLDEELSNIQSMLINKTYYISPNDYTFKIIRDKGKDRELMKLKYNPHRIVQWAVMLHLEKVFTNTFCYHTCASIPNGGIDRAYKLIYSYLMDKENTQYCLKIDVKKFYPSIDKNILKNKLRTKIKDKDLLWLLGLIIDSYPRETGVPIGSYLSQYFANFYLSEFDHYCKEQLKLKYIVRYMDDIIILHKDKEYLRELLVKIQSFWSVKLNLTMKENYQVFPVESRGVDFIGYVFRHKSIRLRKKNALHLRKISNRIKKRQRMNYSDFCSINAVVGFFRYFDSRQLFDTYIRPIFPIITSYYRNNILSDKLTEREKNKKVWGYSTRLGLKRDNYKYKRFENVFRRR